MFTALAKALGAGLSIWEHKEKFKYVDQLLKLKKEYYAEDNKAPSERDDAVLDNLYFQLCLLSDSFAASVVPKDA